MTANPNTNPDAAPGQARPGPAPSLLEECRRQRAEIERLKAALVLSVEALDQFGKNFPVSGIKASIKSSEGFFQNLTHAAAGTALRAARAALQQTGADA